jgi:hypothetical protein
MLHSGLGKLESVKVGKLPDGEKCVTLYLGQFDLWMKHGEALDLYRQLGDALFPLPTEDDLNKVFPDYESW